LVKGDKMTTEVVVSDIPTLHNICLRIAQQILPMETGLAVAKFCEGIAKANKELELQVSTWETELYAEQKTHDPNAIGLSDPRLVVELHKKLSEASQKSIPIATPLLKAHAELLQLSVADWFILNKCNLICY
jgi:hypothetical protein